MSGRKEKRETECAEQRAMEQRRGDTPKVEQRHHEERRDDEERP
jgi:hypothetical protein